MPSSIHPPQSVARGNYPLGGSCDAEGEGEPLSPIQAPSIRVRRSLIRFARLARECDSSHPISVANWL
jgi:hypothetical protein